jgi:hypothetical protein
MRYRKLDPSDDFSFGHGQADFHINTPDAVGQAIKTRLELYTGEWFLDLSEGMPWGGFPLNDAVVARGAVLGSHTQLTRDIALKTRVLGTQGVQSISNYGSSTDTTTRAWSASMTVDTIYGERIKVIFGVGLSGVFEVDVSPIDGGAPML